MSNGTPAVVRKTHNLDHLVCFLRLTSTKQCSFFLKKRLDLSEFQIQQSYKSNVLTTLPQSKDICMLVYNIVTITTSVSIIMFLYATTSINSKDRNLQPPHPIHHLKQWWNGSFSQKQHDFATAGTRHIYRGNKSLKLIKHEAKMCK